MYYRCSICNKLFIPTAVEEDVTLDCGVCQECLDASCEINVYGDAMLTDTDEELVERILEVCFRT